MRTGPKIPSSVAFGCWLIRVAARLVPSRQRLEWQRDWIAEIWHQWQFLEHEGAWTRRETIHIVRSACEAIPDAIRQLNSQEDVRSRLQELMRSPLSFLFSLGVAIILFVSATGGLPATRELTIPLGHDHYDRLIIISLHPIIGSGDQGVPYGSVTAWRKNSDLLESLSPFTFADGSVSAEGSEEEQALVVTTEPSFFNTLQVRPEIGDIPQKSLGVVIDHKTWVSVFRGDRHIIGTPAWIDGRSYPVAGVLPANFLFLSRERAIYLIRQQMTAASAMIVARARSGVDLDQLNRELTRILRDCCYYTWNFHLRITRMQSILLTPLPFFALAATLSALLVAAVLRAWPRRLRTAWAAKNRSATLRRGAFFLCKAGLGLLLVFTASLEISRPQSSLLLGWRDGGSGPLLMWLYVLGTMAVFFFSIADQRARCRVCLRLLCFPVRIGCPGCLLLDWAGTELLCSEGHGVLHVPHLAASWNDEAEQWVSLDESWRELFTQDVKL